MQQQQVQGFLVRCGLGEEGGAIGECFPKQPQLAALAQLKQWLLALIHQVEGNAELLGGPQTLMIGRVLWDEFFSNNDWPMAASVAVVMVLLIIVPIAFFNKYQAENTGGNRA